MPQTRTVLSLEPNALMAKFLTAGGVWLIDSSPTAWTGWARGAPSTAATSSATPRATRAVTTPMTAPRPTMAPRVGAAARQATLRGGGGFRKVTWVFVPAARPDCRPPPVPALPGPDIASDETLGQAGHGSGSEYRNVDL